MPRAAPPGSRASPSAAATPVRRGMGKGRGEGRRVRGRGYKSFPYSSIVWNRFCLRFRNLKLLSRQLPVYFNPSIQD